MRTFNFAIIGCGRIAERHANHISNLGRLAAVCDIIPERADTLGRKYDARAYYSVESLLDGKKILMLYLSVLPMVFMLNILLKRCALDVMFYVKNR